MGSRQTQGERGAGRPGPEPPGAELGPNALMAATANPEPLVRWFARERTGFREGIWGQFLQDPC